MMKTRYVTWCCGIAAAAAIAVAVVGCGGTGGGSAHHDNPSEQFVLNSNNSGRLILNVDPAEVNANESDRIGLVATLTDSEGTPIRGTLITFFSDIDDISFIPGDIGTNGRNFGQAVTDSHGNADIIAVAGMSPTSTGAIVGTGAIFAEPPSGFGLLAQAEVTLLDVGFIGGNTLQVIPPSFSVIEPAPGSVIFFTVVGGKPPYFLSNEVSALGVATLSQHCLPGCTENGGALCIGSPCQVDADCGAGSPAGTCIGPIKHCLASCHGTNCAGSRCNTDADCNDGSSTPANVCKDSGQSIAFTLSGGGDCPDGCLGFTLHDSAGASLEVTVKVSFICGNGVARGNEQCDLGDLRGQTCASLGFVGGGTLLCDDKCKFDTMNCQAALSPSPVVTPTAPAATLTFTPTPLATDTPTPTLSATPTPTLTPTPFGTPGAPANLTLSLLANCAGQNADTTLTTVVAAVVTDTNSNAVSDGTGVLFSITGPNAGAVINSPSQTNADPPCNVTNFVSQCGFPVANQHGVAHTCITYPNGQQGTGRTVNGMSGAASDSQFIFPLPGAPTLTPTPTPTATP